MLTHRMLVLAIRRTFACCLVVSFSGSALADNPVAGILGQAKGLPREFSEHFFDVPLAVRVDLDGRLLGEAMIVVTRDEHVQLLEFTDISESHETPVERQRWMNYLHDVRSLGTCAADCTNGLVAVHYSLRNSQLSILTRAVEQRGNSMTYTALPDNGSSGLILRNQLNLSGAGSETVGRYGLSGLGSIGQWSTRVQAQVDRSLETSQGTRHRVDQLYGERLRDNRFYRLGYFTPGIQGLARQPRLLGDQPQTTLGMMLGTSDSLLLDNPTASATPLYVTPDRQGVAEIYRNGVLINSQPVQPGLQSLDTTVLPGGIYEVQVRVIEDGSLASTTEASIYKPSSWSNVQEPWRYNLYLGQQSELLSNWQDARTGSLSAGLIGNYLVHPRAIAGLSVQRVDEQMQYGSSMDWEAGDHLKLYGNAFVTERRGNGYDLQALYTYPHGNLVLSHSRTWQYFLRERYSDFDDPLRQRERFHSREGQEVTQSSLSLHHRLTLKDTGTLRLSHSDGVNAGVGVDLSGSRRARVLGSEGDWRLSVFDRPASFSQSSRRNRGVNVSLSLNLGQPGRRLSASLGDRTSREGGNDRNGSLTYQQDVDYGALRAVAGTLSMDRYGAGTAFNGRFQNGWSSGDAYLQSSSYNGELGGGLNLDSTLALGGGTVALSGDMQRHDAGLIVDVQSDIESLQLYADDIAGPGALLHPGRNFLAVSPWRPGQVQFDFAGRDGHAAVIQPATLSYHLNRGGVQHHTVRVMRSVTVLGRLLDAGGLPLGGAMIINHAGRGVSEADGFFTVEVSESTPLLEVRRQGAHLCLLNLDDSQATRENDLLLVGDQRCLSKKLVGAAASGAGDA